VEKECGGLKVIQDSKKYWENANPHEEYFSKESCLEYALFYENLIKLYTYWKVDRLKQYEQVYDRYDLDEETRIYNKDTEVMAEIIKLRARLWT